MKHEYVADEIEKALHSSYLETVCTPMDVRYNVADCPGEVNT